MRKKNKSVLSTDSRQTISSFKFEDDCENSPWLSQQLLAHYKHKSIKLEKDYDKFLELLENIKSTCDLSRALQLELRSRNEELCKLQQIIGDLQVRLFHEREENIVLIAENDKLKIQDHQSKKKINILLMINGMTEKSFCNFLATNIEGEFVKSQLPFKLQKLKEEKLLLKYANSNNTLSSYENNNLQPLPTDNQILFSQLKKQLKIAKEQNEVLLKEKDLLVEEKIMVVQRLQKEVDLLSSKLKETQDLLCTTTEKLINSEHFHEKDKTTWIEEKEKNNRIINFLKIQLGESLPDVFDCHDAAIAIPGENDIMNQKILEKEKLLTSYQEKVSLLQEEINKLGEKETKARKIFKEKTEKMNAHIFYLKSKYEDLDRRRHLEAEGFHSDIKILRNRLKVVEKKIEKASNSIQGNEQQQLLISAKNTLNRAKLLQKELTDMKMKISSLESNTEHSTL